MNMLKLDLPVNVMNVVVARYNEPHRRYHNLFHITNLFQLAAAKGIPLSRAQQLAIWFHDVVYDPQETMNNEQRSAQLMNDLLKDHLPDSILRRATNMILATKRHVSDDHETQIVLDLDLAGLGADHETYFYNKQQIREEYSYLSDESWINGRKIFITNMLNRKFIFETHWGRESFEDNARKNLMTDLQSLSL